MAPSISSSKFPKAERNFDNPEETKAILNEQVNKAKNIFINNNCTVLQEEQAKQVFSDGKMFYLTSAKIVYPHLGIVNNRDMYFFKTDCVNAIIVDAADVDAQYWRSIILKMITGAQ
ncbi:MAG: hypothetical protein H6Q67_1657 [Firmicutes bacterium]|nr:hypothetical protein [Bacillota bacterium]